MSSFWASAPRSCSVGITSAGYSRAIKLLLAFAPWHAAKNAQFFSVRQGLLDLVTPPVAELVQLEKISHGVMAFSAAFFATISGRSG